MCLTAISLDQKVIGNISPFFWCFQLRITSELYPSPTRTHTHIFFCKPCCLGWFPFKPQKTHPSQGAQYSYLLQLYHSEQMTGIGFLYYLQHSFIPYVKPNSAESHSQNIIIENHIHWGFPQHFLGFPGRDTAPHSECQHHFPAPFCVQQQQWPLAVQLSCLLFFFLCSVCLDILFTMDLGLLWAGHFLCLSLTPGSHFLLGIYVGFCHLHKIFCPNISTWSIWSCLFRLLLPHLWGSGIQ